MRICIGVGSGSGYRLCWWMVRVLFRFRAGVDVRCYILYYTIILYIVRILLYILYLILYYPLRFLLFVSFPPNLLFLPSSILQYSSSHLLFFSSYSSSLLSPILLFTSSVLLPIISIYLSFQSQSYPIQSIRVGTSLRLFILSSKNHSHLPLPIFKSFQYPIQE